MKLIAAIILATASCVPEPAPAAHVRQPYGLECTMAGDALAAGQARYPEATVVRMDGALAAKLLDGINHTGEPTAFTARSLVIGLFADRVMVSLFSPCFSGTMQLKPETFHEAFETAFGARV